MKNTHFLIAAGFSGLFAISPASAAIQIDTVLVGDTGNANDGTGYGGVSYNYRIGTHEVTNSQYTAFLNAKAATDTHSLYSSNMNSSTHGGIQQSGTSGSFTYSAKSGFENKPVNFVSFWDAARFSNWLTNGQGSSDTETGMYNLGGVTNPTNSSITRQIDFSSGQNGVAIASRDEWYKAAYYDGSGAYYQYPTQSNTEPNAIAPNSSDANSVNTGFVAVGTVTDVGSYTLAESNYGTFDQGGNVWEWNDNIVGTNERGMVGSSWVNQTKNTRSNNGLNSAVTAENSDLGFRVTSLAPIPEPSAYAAIIGCLGLGFAVMRRKGQG